MGKKHHTLEKHLNILGKADPGAKGLESVYDLQKRKLGRYLSSVVTTFPTYSTHDTFHSVNIIVAIESILGSRRIKRLSGIDAFLILMCAYMHDIGMLYTEDEVRELWKKDEFTAFLQDARHRSHEAAKAVGLVEGAMMPEGDGKKLWALEVRQSVTILLMEYYRSRHGLRIEEVTKKDVGGIADLLRVEDSFLPDRILKMINSISMAHTWSFRKMMDALPREDSFNGEFFHPRMIAFLLRIGDLCDLDNNRFNKVGIATFGTLGDESLAHYFKHKSIETLYISPEEIKVVADVVQENIEAECRREWMPAEDEEPLQERTDKVFHRTIQEHISWKSWMEQEITDAKLNARRIFPDSLSFQVPEVEYVIRIDGREAVSSNRNLKFAFSQEKAFGLIENISIYQNEKLIFVRELIQNAIDASKMQIWRDICADMGEGAQALSPFELEWRYPGIFSKYKIDIRVEYDSAERKARFRITDSGIGISIPELKENVLATGSSWNERERYRKELQQMPGWLRPTGAFGIGLHTAFSVTDQIRILTKSETEEQANEITLYSGKKDGHAFCRKTAGRTKRGTVFSLSFVLTEEEERLYLEEGDEKEFLYDVDNELENKIIAEVQRWCNTPLVPIEVNGQPVVPALVMSTWVNELYQEERCNRILYCHEEDARYLYAFSHDYGGLTVWDRENEAVLHMVLDRSADINVNFKGICLSDDLGVGLQEYISIRYLDILAGDAGEMIDASRSRLKYEAVGKVKKALKEGAAFAKKTYLALMEAVASDEQHMKFMGDVRQCADGYLAGGMDRGQVWRRACQLKKKYLDSGDSRLVRRLESRVVTYMICLRIVDSVLLESARNWWTEEDFAPDAVMQSFDMAAWSLLDDVLRRWRADWRGNSQRFVQGYFRYQIKSVAAGYLNCWTMLVVERYMQTRHIVKPEEREQWRRAIRERLGHAMPFTWGWHVTRQLCHKAAEDILDYCWGGNNILYNEEMLDAIVVPVTAKVFREWGYKAAYAGIDSISLELSRPYARLLLDMPDRLTEIGQSERDIWKRELGRTVYGMLGRDVEGIEDYSGLLEMRGLTLRMPRDRFRASCLPFLRKLTIIKADVKENERKLTYAYPEYAEGGISADERTIRAAFRFFWETVEAVRPDDQLGYLDIDGFRKYPLLVLESGETGHDEWLQTGWNRCYIPIWDYLLKIRGYLDSWRCDERREACLEGIAGSRRFQAVTNYIWKKKGREKGLGEDGLAQIQEQYKEFVRDLLDVWFEEMPRG